MFVGIREVLAIDSHDILDYEVTLCLLNHQFVLFIYDVIFVLLYLDIGVPPSESWSVRRAMIMIYLGTLEKWTRLSTLL